MRRLFALLPLALLLACPPAPPMTAAPIEAGAPLSPDDGGTLKGVAATCANWCAHANALGCPAARPTPAGAPCTAVCENVQRGEAKWTLACRVAARTCAAADACEN